MMKLFSLFLLCAVAASVSLTAPSKNIVELAVATPDLSTLVTALKAGNLTGALSGAGPFTVFAPTNEAFAKLPADVLKYLLDPANIKKLQAVLEYHVVAGAAVYSKDLKEYQKVKTLEGDDVFIIKKHSSVYINMYAQVTTADVGASNGVVHIINHVLLPRHMDLIETVKSNTLSAPDKNIVELAVATPDLSTLVTALKAGKLTGALSGAGPFTVFAPTNEAFAKLPADVLKYLLDPANIKKLQAVLEYHVISGAAVYSKDLKEFQKVKTLEGDDVFIVKKGSSVYINMYAQVTTADVGASNGVVHIINHVLLPRHMDFTYSDESSSLVEADKNIVELAVATPDLSTLVTALKAGNLTGALSGAGPFTVFAPTNEAFAKLPADVLKYLLDPANIKKLQAVLEYHVVAGAAVYSKDLKEYQQVKTLEGEELFIVKKHSSVYINLYAQVTTADVSASNGVVHIINHVLLPRHVIDIDMSNTLPAPETH